MWTKMSHAFQALYEYLADTDSTTDLRNSHTLSGGICITQNIKAFNDRNGFKPLPHALPLLPELPTKRRTVTTQKGLRSFKLGIVNAATTDREMDRDAWLQATNSSSDDTLTCELVHVYQRFEEQELGEELSVTEASKVRWLLIYSTLQMLISITCAPKEVRDTESTPYALCVLITGGPNWLDDQTEIQSPSTPFALHFQEMSPTPQTSEVAEERSSIRPDCEAESANEYFASSTISGTASEVSLSMTPSPLRITTKISETASIRSGVHSGVHVLHRSVVGSPSRHNSLIQPSSIASSLRKSTSFCEILISGYGNGADARVASARHVSLDSPHRLKTLDPLDDFDFCLAEVNEEPTLEVFRLDAPRTIVAAANYSTKLHGRRPESSASAIASDSSSARSSSCLEYDSPITELDSSPRNSDKACLVRNSSLSSHSPSLRHRPSHLRKLAWPAPRADSLTIVAGVYVPTGLPTAGAFPSSLRAGTECGDTFPVEMSDQAAMRQD